jgi:hypothetical protein
MWTRLIFLLYALKYSPFALLSTQRARRDCKNNNIQTNRWTNIAFQLVALYIWLQVQKNYPALILPRKFNFFENYTVQRIHSMNTRTQILSLWAPLKDWAPDRPGDSRSHHWRLVIDGNAAYHLTQHNAGKSWENPSTYRPLIIY